MPYFRRGLRACHRASALILGVFLAAHIANHLAGVAGQDVHRAVMAAMRPIYRHPLIEPILLILLLGQAISGLCLVVRGWRGRRGAVAWLQALTGLYLVFFLTLHIVSVLAGRWVLHLDTDFRFAAAGFHVPVWPWFFGPYYFLGIAALFAHAGCAMFWAIGSRSRARKVLIGMIALGIGAGTLIVSALAGALYPVDIPAAYRATYAAR